MLASLLIVLAANPTWDLGAESQIGASVNRLGALADVKLRAKHGLYDSESEFFRDNGVTFALDVQLSPVFANAGVQLDFQPASFVKLSTGYQFVDYFGTMGTTRALASCERGCDYHPYLFEDEPAGRASTGHRFFAEAQLMGRVGDVITVANLRAEQWLMNVDSAAWVNELYGLAQNRNDTVLNGGGAVLYALLNPTEHRPELLLGVADEVTTSLGAKALFNRVGPVAMLRFPKLGAWRDATIQAAALVYTNEPYLAGRPYVCLGFGITTPELPSRLDR